MVDQLLVTWYLNFVYGRQFFIIFTILKRSLECKPLSLVMDQLQWNDLRVFLYHESYPRMAQI